MRMGVEKPGFFEDLCGDREILAETGFLVWHPMLNY